MKDEQKAYESLQKKIQQVFKKQLADESYTPTQENLLNVMLAKAVKRSGGPDKVTLDQVRGIEEMLEEEFGLAAALDDRIRKMCHGCTTTSATF